MRVLKKVLQFLICSANVYDCLPLATVVVFGIDTNSRKEMGTRTIRASFVEFFA